MIHINQFIRESDLNPVDLFSFQNTDRLTFYFGNDFATGQLVLVIHSQPVELLVSNAQLMPDNFRGQRVANKPGHPRDGNRIFAVHPVSFAFVNHDFVLVPFWISFLQVSEFDFPFRGNLVAIVGGIVATHVQCKTNVP